MSRLPARKPLTVILDDEIVSRVDQLSKRRGLTRSEFIRVAVARELDGDSEAHAHVIEKILMSNGQIVARAIESVRQGDQPSA